MLLVAWGWPLETGCRSRRWGYVSAIIRFFQEDRSYNHWFQFLLMHGVIHADLPGIEVTNIDPCVVALP